MISPLLSNIYLHEVLDKWFEEVVRPRLKGKGFLIRYADDGLLCFENEEDARRVMEVLPKRFDKYGLTIHPEKTRLVMFVRPESEPREDHDRRERETFSFLGFMHYWGKSRKGNWIIKRSTDKGRFARALRKVSDWCKRNRHLPISEQHAQLTRKLWGHYSYYGITGNSRRLANFRYQVIRVWRKWLSRRSRSGCISWEKFTLLMRRYTLPPVRIMHSVYSVNL